MRKIISILIYILDFIIPKRKNQFVFSSFPDVSDNSYGMFQYIYQLYKNDEVKFTWLISDISQVENYRARITNEMKLSDENFNNIQFVEKNSIQGLLYYIRAKYVFFTHGLYPQIKLPHAHVLINLWHGMPLKRIGYLDNNNKSVPLSTYVISTSEFFQNFMSQAFSQNIKSTLISGQPRNDLMFINQNTLMKLGIEKKSYNKVFLWTPTYRKSIIGDLRNDGQVTNELPVIDHNINELNEILKEIHSFMIIKLHPMDILTLNKFDNFSNLVFLINSDLDRKECSLYALLGEVDVLLTDFSSIYIDYLLLDRPIGFVMDDFDKYENSRGFVMENPKDYMPGQFITQKKELFKFLKNCVNRIDDFHPERKNINKIFNIQKDNYAEYLWTMTLDKDKNK